MGESRARLPAHPDRAVLGYLDAGRVRGAVAICAPIKGIVHAVYFRPYLSAVRLRACAREIARRRTEDVGKWEEDVRRWERESRARRERAQEGVEQRIALTAVLEGR